MKPPDKQTAVPNLFTTEQVRDYVGSAAILDHLVARGLRPSFTSAGGRRRMSLWRRAEIDAALLDGESERGPRP